jgi:hypothetical protein
MLVLASILDRSMMTTYLKSHVRHMILNDLKYLLRLMYKEFIILDKLLDVSLTFFVVYFQVLPMEQ